MSRPFSRLWKLSCAVNRLAGGRRDEPLCSRVYRQPPSRLRSLYIACIDKLTCRLWGDWLHCLHIHATFLLYDSEKKSAHDQKSL